ncbi:hypothetical protein DMENIID0001_134510 [Sergentomyia squamirostris]
MAMFKKNQDPAGNQVPHQDDYFKELQKVMRELSFHLYRSAGINVVLSEAKKREFAKLFAEFYNKWGLPPGFEDFFIQQLTQNFFASGHPEIAQIVGQIRFSANQ